MLQNRFPYINLNQVDFVDVIPIYFFTIHLVAFSTPSPNVHCDLTLTWTNNSIE